MAEQKQPRKPGTGVAFVNENKKEDWHADWTGEFADHDGNLFYLNISKKTAGHSGREYISVSLGKPKVAKDAPSNSAPKPIHEMIDDIPF
ncbi:hypothetical protein EB001_06645 [bacterium]|nr:hypothetical protein [bacterium]